MYSVKENSMKRKLFGAAEHYDKSESNAASAEKKRRRKNAVETPKHYPKSERQQLALVLQMTSADKSPGPRSPSFTSTRKTPGGSGRKDKVHKRNVRGETLLHICTIRGDLDAMKELIRQGADVNVQDFAGWTPLHEACNHGHQEITRYLLQVGANVNSKGLEDDTPLHDAVTNSHRDLVELLLKHGANPLLKNKRGERPLDIAEDQVIRELMQKEVMLSEEESDSEQECPSPSRSEESIHKKDRTMSTSPSRFQDLFKWEKKKHQKSKSDSKKSQSSMLTSDSSSDSDTSDGSSIAPKNFCGDLSRSNGFSSSTPRKPQSLSTSLLKAAKPKKKPKRVDKSDIKRNKMKMYSGNSTLACMNPSDVSLDSGDGLQRKDKNGAFLRHGDFDKYSLVKNEKKYRPKRKSLYADDESLIADKNTKQTDPAFKKKSPHHGNNGKRARSSSHDTGLSHSKLKDKSNKLLVNELKRYSENVMPAKVNGFQTAADSSAHKKDHIDESIYDFSPSAEDLSNSSAISLRQGDYLKGNSSELFDILCLGKSGGVLDPQMKDRQVLDLNVRVTPKAVNVQSKPSRLFLSNDHLDKNNNDFLQDESKTPKKVPTPSNGPLSQSRTLDNPGKTNETFEKAPVAKLFAASLEAADMKKEDSRSERKIKKRKLSVSPKKSPHSNMPMAIIKSDASAKTESVKSESSFDGKQEKPKKSIEPSSSSSFIKKKKKHKHKHSHDTTAGEHKHRQRLASNEHSSLEKLNGAERTNQFKSLLKKSESMKLTLGALSRKGSQEGKSSEGSTQGASSRKASQEGKSSEGAVVPAAKKKAVSTDGASAEASSKSSKHISVTKAPKPVASGAPQEKQSTSVSTKKDKPEAKKITLTDANCSFLSELEKSSRQRLELEKKMKIQRKRKLMQQQQRLKAQSAAESVSKEIKLSTPTSEKPSLPSDKSVFEPHDFAEATSAQQMRPHAVSVDRHHASQMDPRQQHHHNSIDPYQDSTNSLDRPEFLHDTLKPPPLAARSVSQIDHRLPYLDDCNRQEKPPRVVPHEMKCLPVHKSLSFSGQSPSGPLHSDVPLHHQDDARHWHSITEFQHHQVPNYPAAPTNIPLPCDANGPSLPSVNHPPSQNYFCAAQTLSQKLDLPMLEPSDTVPGPSGSSVASFPSNVPISSPLVANVPIHAAMATPPTGSTSNVTDFALGETKADVGSESKVEESDKPCDGEQEAERRDSSADNADLDQENQDLAKEASAGNTPREEEETVSSAEKERIEREIALEKYIKERLSEWKLMLQVPMKLPFIIPMAKLKNITEKDPDQDRLNTYEEWAVLQKQIKERRKKSYTAVVIPQAPPRYCDYITYTGTYLLSDDRESWFSFRFSAPPPSLTEEMRVLFVEHEKERVKLRLQHTTQREKLIIACEQEIMRVHSRAARTLQNQQIPLSACSIFLDGEIYNLERRGKKKVPDDGSNGRAAIRDRFNGRMMLSWQQDVNDKYVKLKGVLLSRQRNESQALHAVQRTEWFLKLQEAEKKGQQKRWTNLKPEDVSGLYVPLVNISDDFDLLPG